MLRYFYIFCKLKILNIKLEGYVWWLERFCGLSGIGSYGVLGRRGYVCICIA